MKKYIIIYASHIESDGLDSGNSIVCDTREEAQQILKNNYQGLKKSINKEDSKNLAAPINTTAAYKGIAQKIISPEK